MQRHKAIVIILNYNGLIHLQTYLPEIIEHTPYSIPIYMADNASKDDSVRWVKAQFPKVLHFQNEQNFGYAGGYNLAIKAIETDYVILLNSDLKVEANYAEFLIAAIDESDKIAAVQPKVLSLVEPQNFEYAGAAGGWIDGLGFPFCRGRILDTIEPDKHQYDQNTRIFWASGAACIVRREAFLEVGGFDDRFFAHQEEIDLCYRLQLAGYEIHFEHRSVVHHLGGGTLHYDSPFKLRLNLRNNLWMLLKNKPSTTLIWLLPLRLSLDGVLALRYILKGKFGHLTAILKAHYQFYSGIGYIIGQRRKVQRKVAEAQLQGVFRKNMLWRYHIAGEKKFTDLKIPKSAQDL
ncbi:MAG: glycosyltransferase family 2 protein [Saprospiraceae bacterium]